MDPKAELEKRYPQADFSVYFRFLSAAKTVKDADTQEHHICPRAQFPEYEKTTENKIILKIDDHAFAHKLLSAAHPDFKKHIAAWLSKGRNGNCLRGRKIGPHTKERLANIAKTLSGRHLSKEHKAAIALSGKGKQAGEKNAQAKLSIDKVLEIRKRHASGETGVSLSAAFHVGNMTISRIVHRQRWAHI